MSCGFCLEATGEECVWSCLSYGVKRQRGFSSRKVCRVEDGKRFITLAFELAERLVVKEKGKW